MTAPLPSLGGRLSGFSHWAHDYDLAGNRIDDFVASAVLLANIDARRIGSTWFASAEPAARFEVSTVFLVTDRSYGEHTPPLLWETRIFGGPFHGANQPYDDQPAAVAGHARWIAYVGALFTMVEHNGAPPPRLAICAAPSVGN